MPNFARVKPAGYGANDNVTSAEFNQLDIDHAASVNGDGGGTYLGALHWGGEHVHNDHVFLEGGVSYRAASGDLADANHDLTVAHDTYITTAVATGARTYTVRHTGAVIPEKGQRLRAVVRNAHATANARAFVREDAQPLAQLDGGALNGSWAEFEYSGVQWDCIGGGGADFLLLS